MLLLMKPVESGVQFCDPKVCTNPACFGRGVGWRSHPSIYRYLHL